MLQKPYMTIANSQSLHRFIWWVSSFWTSCTSPEPVRKACQSRVSQWDCYQPRQGTLWSEAGSPSAFHMNVRTHRNKRTPKAVILPAHLWKYRFITHLYTVREETNPDVMDKWFAHVVCSILEFSEGCEIISSHDLQYLGARCLEPSSS